MLPRLAAFTIVIFWFVMTLLLVRNEISPEASRLREVPIAHVLKLLYLHEQPSDLAVYNGPTSIGHVRLHPRLDGNPNNRLLDLSGDLQLALTPSQRARFNWLGQLEMTPDFTVRNSRWTLTILDPGYLRAEIETSEASKTAHYVLRTRDSNQGSGRAADRVISEGDLSTDQAGLSGLANQLNLGANLDALMKQGGPQTTPVFRARQSSLKWRGERTETYLVTVEQNGQQLIEAHISQLGQVLLARTALGYTLRSSDLTE